MNVLFKEKINLYINHKHFMNYVFYGNILLITVFSTIAFLLTQGKISYYYQIQASSSELKIISDHYNQKLIEAQATLKPDIKAINNLLKRVHKEHDNITNNTRKINDSDYTKHAQKYVKILSKRLKVSDELINKYDVLSNIYKDYIIAAQNAENVASNDIQLQLMIKHIMLDLEKARLISKNSNRDFIKEKIYELKSKLINESPIIQEKIGLFVDLSNEIIGLMRHLDTIRFSMNSDEHDKKLQILNDETHHFITYEKLKFYAQLSLFIGLAIILLSAQIILLTIFFINKKRTEKLKKDVEETILKSQEVTERAKMYALDVQRNQYKLLRDFCDDFDVIISTIASLSHQLKDGITKTDIYDTQVIESKKISISTLDHSIIALERWLSNYLEIYTAQDDWPPPQEEAINITELFDNHFTEACFFTSSRQHLMSIFHDGFDKDIVKSDKKYLFKMFLNMMYISLKWSQDNYLKSSIILHKNPPEADDDTNDINNIHNILEISFINGASEELFQKGLNIFKQDPAELQDNAQKDNKIASDDRFIITALYFLRQISDILKANITYERNQLEENILSIKIPVNTTADTTSDISVPILNNKRILVISQHPQILSMLEKQLKVFGLNVTTLTDRYSAIGHIIGGEKDSDKKYDLFIIDHHPPEIDATSLTKIIRENSPLNLTHILVIATQDYSDHIDKNKYLYDGHFIKPIKPVLLKSKLEEFINIQLYGSENSNNELDDFNNPSAPTMRCLIVMEDELSTKLLQFLLKKSTIEVDIASSAAQIFEFIEDEYYDFILVSQECQWIMPKNLARDLRRHHTDNKNSVLFFFYEKLKTSEQEKLKILGFDELIELPLTSTIFFDLLEKWVDPATMRTYHSQNLQINSEQNTEDNIDEDINGEIDDNIEDPNNDDDNNDANDTENLNDDTLELEEDDAFEPERPEVKLSPDKKTG